jgi:hypothetical protein
LRAEPAAPDSTQQHGHQEKAESQEQAEEKNQIELLNAKCLPEKIQAESGDVDPKQAVATDVKPGNQ